MITMEELQGYPVADDKEIRDAHNKAVSLIEHNVDEFFDCFPGANSENNFYRQTENTDWTEDTLNWKNKPAILSQYGVVTSEEFNLGSVVSNDPGKISIPNGTVATTDVTEFIAAAKENKQDTVTLAVNVAGTNKVDKANRIFFVSKEGAQAYPDAQNMAPVLIETKTVAVSGLKVNAPTKTVYDLGESLDTTGMTVTASYEDGTEDSVDLSKEIQN